MVPWAVWAADRERTLALAQDERQQQQGDRPAKRPRVAAGAASDAAAAAEGMKMMEGVQTSAKEKQRKGCSVM